ncbi:YdbH domain-containing protein [Photobacterium sp. SDRW27]|uniref:intermembrane phospholipid transport protein YdbH family protein n=1 Tax=Photobacterium obscurum TaxID=2829490 RepID=UPI002244D960|nr:YdbH domain-containing protein [Photobacterium obscurum]MCW8329423.1 YdbH domain-containing protein [Photobacterium obscurum]
MRSRRKRLFLYGLFILLCLLIIPAIIIPPWLASKGIEINAISGISFEEGLAIDEVSIAIDRNALTFRKLSLEHFVDKDSTISNASWRLFAQHTTVSLSPTVKNRLNQQGIRLSNLTFADTAFNFTDLSEPYVFSAHVRQIETLLFDSKNVDGGDDAIKQRIENIDLVLTTQPSLAISGFIQHGALNVIIPGDRASTRYPFNFDNANFSISWQPARTPLSVHIETLEPKWPTITEGYIQSGKNIDLQLDLNQATESVKLTAEQLWLDQPSQLPEFIEKPDNTNQGLHLGRAIANLSLLPVRKLKIHDFNYGELIIHSLLVLETPKKRLNKPDKNTKLRLTGKALGPDPYDIDVLLKHLNDNDAHFSGQIIGPKGNALQCKANLHFVSPLPESLTCNANFANTKDLTDRLKLYDIPNATLSEPLVFTATQTSLLRETDKYAINSGPDSSSIPSNQPTQLPTNLNDITQASYQVDLKLPGKIGLALNQFAFEHPILSPTNSNINPVSQVSFTTDGTLALDALYKNNKLKVVLSEPSERLMLESIEHQSFFSLLIKKLECAIRLDQFRSPSSLQCHSQSTLQAKVHQLFPANDTELNTVSLASDISLKWSDSKLDMQAQNNELSIDRAQLSVHPGFIKSHATDIVLKTGHINLLQTTSSTLPEQPKLQISSDTDITFSSHFYGEKLISDPHTTEQQRQLLIQDKKSVPVQKYNGKLELALSNASLTQSGRLLKLDTHYQTTLSLKQNEQRLPPFSSQGNISFTPDSINIAGTVNNMKQALLIQFTVDSDLNQQTSRIKLHRNDISFNPKRSLKKHYMPHLPIDYDLNNGTISFNADLRLHKEQLTGEFGVFADSLSGNIHGFHFADLNASFTASVTPNGIKSKYPISLQVGLLHAGVLLENIFALVEFDTEKKHYRLDRASAYAFGGSVSTHDVSSSALTYIPDIPVIIHRLDLEKLIQAIDAKDIVLTGVLDGNFPMSIVDGMPVIRNGKLHSRYPGGVLRYKEGSSIGENVEAAGENSLMVVSQILKNYKYDSLSIDIDYSKEGQLNASSRFKGYNPDFQNGQPVYVNLNIEDNIPALIKTLNVINSTKLESLFLKQLGLDE